MIRIPLIDAWGIVHLYNFRPDQVVKSGQSARPMCNYGAGTGNFVLESAWHTDTKYPTCLRCCAL